MIGQAIAPWLPLVVIFRDGSGLRRAPKDVVQPCMILTFSVASIRPIV